MRGAFANELWTLAGQVRGRRRALLLSGCADGIDLNGKVFDMMGISPAAAGGAPVRAASRRARPAGRAARRPPGCRSRARGRRRHRRRPRGRTIPSSARLREAKERERLHLAYCRGDMQWKERALNKESVSAPRSPYGPCPTIFGGVNVNVNKE